MKMPHYTVTANNINIQDSYKISKVYFSRCLARIEVAHPDCLVWKRKRCSLKLEWATHNALYDLHLFRSRTQSVDLNYPIKWYMKIVYAVVGCIVYPFIP